VPIEMHDDVLGLRKFDLGAVQAFLNALARSRGLLAGLARGRPEQLFCVGNHTVEILNESVFGYCGFAAHGDLSPYS
jgi:hypothetical protein